MESILQEETTGSKPVTNTIPDKTQCVRFRLSGGKRQLIREFLDGRDGHRCFYCESTQALEIHRKDPTKDYTLKNCLWACQKCNLSKRIYAKESTRQPSVCVPAEPPDPIAINREKEPMWLRFMSTEIERLERVERNYIRREASNYCNISPATHNRYLDKHLAATRGNFSIELDTEAGLTYISLRKRPQQ